MRKAERKDKNLVCDILASCFFDNPSVIYTLKGEGKNKDAIYSLMIYSFEVCFNTGFILINEKENACLLVKNSKQKIPFFKQFLLDFELLRKGVGLKKIIRVLKREKKIKKLYHHDHYLYLWYIGVRPKEQGKGFGTSLIKTLLCEANDKVLPIYLETSVEENVLWYKNQFGFRENGTLHFNTTLYSLLWEQE